MATNAATRNRSLVQAALQLVVLNAGPDNLELAAGALEAKPGVKRRV
jgi:hypothetical protein